jgi:hypothetical protein
MNIYSRPESRRDPISISAPFSTQSPPAIAIAFY